MSLVTIHGCDQNHHEAALSILASIGKDKHPNVSDPVWYARALCAVEQVSEHFATADRAGYIPASILIQNANFVRDIMVPTLDLSESRGGFVPNHAYDNLYNQPLGTYKREMQWVQGHRNRRNHVGEIYLKNRHTGHLYYTLRRHPWSLNPSKRFEVISESVKDNEIERFFRTPEEACDAVHARLGYRFATAWRVEERGVAHFCSVYGQTMLRRKLQKFREAFHDFISTHSKEAG